MLFIWNDYPDSLPLGLQYCDLIGCQAWMATNPGSLPPCRGGFPRQKNPRRETFPPTKRQNVKQQTVPHTVCVVNKHCKFVFVIEKGIKIIKATKGSFIYTCITYLCIKKDAYVRTFCITYSMLFI
jgi:hypothetical protein